MRPPLFAAIILFAGSLVAGLGFCALFPPFDGFDETAHYSYIQQIAQTGTWPRLNDPVTADVDDYLKVAPSTIALKARWSYPAFSKHPPTRCTPARPRFMPSGIPRGHGVPVNRIIGRVGTLHSITPYWRRFGPCPKAGATTRN